jgi:hypothetical protein
MSKRKTYEETVSDPRVIALLSTVIRCSRRSYFRRDEHGRDTIANVKLELIAMGVGGCMATRLLQEYPFPEGEFRYNRKRNGKLPTAEELEARRGRKELRAAVVAEFNLRNFPPMNSFTVEWDNWLFRRSDLDPNRLKRKAGRPSNHTARTLLEVLGDQDLSSTEWAAQCKEMGISNGSFYVLLGELKKSGRIHQCAMDMIWEVVKSGQN